MIDAKEYEVFIKVLFLADLMFLHKFTGHREDCATVPQRHIFACSVAA